MVMRLFHHLVLLMIKVTIQIPILQIILQAHPLRLLLLSHKTLISTKKNNRVTTKKLLQSLLHSHIHLFHLLGSLIATTTLTYSLLLVLSPCKYYLLL